jgi:hypothetical protein
MYDLSPIVEGRAELQNPAQERPRYVRVALRILNEETMTRRVSKQRQRRFKAAAEAYANAND